MADSYIKDPDAVLDYHSGTGRHGCRQVTLSFGNRDG